MNAPRDRLGWLAVLVALIALAECAVVAVMWWPR